MNFPRFTQFLKDLDTVRIESDFINFATGQDGWTSLVADAGTTAAVSDGVNGVVALGTAATDNNEVAVRTTTELFLFGANRGIYGLSYIQYTEANTDDANVFIGFCSALAANTLVDDGAGVRTSGSIAGIYKVDGGTVWRCHSRNGSASTDTISTTTAGGAAYQKLEVIINGDYDGGTNVEVLYKVDGVYLKDSNNNVIRHTVAIASATEMNYGHYVKAGGANAETLNVDYGYAAQNRV